MDTWSKNYIKQMLQQDYGKGILLITSEIGRRTGKTTALIEVAAEKDVPILCKNVGMADYIRRTSDNMGLKVNVYVFNEHLLGRKFVGVLLEEGFNDKEISDISQHFKVLGGYKYVSSHKFTVTSEATRFVEPTPVMTQKPKKSAKIQIVLDNGDTLEKLIATDTDAYASMKEIIERGYMHRDSDKIIRVWYPPHRIFKLKYIKE